MTKRYQSSASLILLGCIAAVAFISCGGKTDEKKTLVDNGGNREKMIAELVERLESYGFVRFDENERYSIYEKMDVKLPELSRQLGLKSTDAFRQTPNSPPDEWILKAEIADNVFCVVYGKRGTDKTASTPPESLCYYNAHVVVGRNAEVVPMVLKIGMDVGDAKLALEKHARKMFHQCKKRIVPAHNNYLRILYFQTEQN